MGLFFEIMQVTAPGIMSTTIKIYGTFTDSCTVSEVIDFIEYIVICLNDSGGAICCLTELCLLDSLATLPIFPPMADSGLLPAHSDICESPKSKEDKVQKRSGVSGPLRYLEVSFLTPCKGSLEVGVEHHILGDNDEARSGETHELGVADLPKGCLAAKIYSMKDKKKRKVLVEASYSY